MTKAVVGTKRKAPKKDLSKTPTLNKPKAKVVGNARIEYEHTSNIPQSKLEELEILCPLSIKQEKYINDDENDIVVWGGAASAGKTQCSLLLIALEAMFDENYTAGVARYSQRQMKQPGSLWSAGCKLFGKWGVGSNRQELTWAFPSGAEVKCHHLDGNQDDWQGSQMTKMLVDESQQCTESDVWYLVSRLRSTSDKKHQLRLTCNPSNKSFLCRWLVSAGYIDEFGFPDKAMDGVTTFMVEIEGEFKWFKSKSEITKECGKEVADAAQKFVFYAANVYDNPYIRKHQPTYVTKLQNMKKVEKDRLLFGNWFASEVNNGYIKREFFRTVSRSEIPLQTPRTRCWDLAGTQPHAGYKNPDWTRGIQATYDSETGIFYILDMKSLRDRAALVQALIERTAFEDGRDCYIGIPKDVGSAGKLVAEQKQAILHTNGFKCYVMDSRAGKAKRAESFLIALQEGKVCVLDGVFSDRDYDELENFDGLKNGGHHDDIMDSISDSYLLHTTNRLIPIIKMGEHKHRLTNIGGKTLL